MTSRAQRIEDILNRIFHPARLTMVDESAKHASHLARNNVAAGGETHFQLALISEAFTGLSRVERSRAVHAALAAEFESGLHALSLNLKTPREAEAAAL